MKKLLKVLGIILFSIVLIVFAIVAYIKIALPNVGPAPEISVDKSPERVARGYYLANRVMSCMDCHSNNTRYRWYFKIQPVDWWLTNHINEGKQELNFDEYASKSLRYQYHKMESTVDLLKKGEMPLDSYLWLHKDAILTEQEKNTLINWAQGITNEMKAKYPTDSLVRKKR